MMRSLMRVLYVSHFGGLGGAERSMLELMIEIRRLGVEPLLLCPDGPLAQAAATAEIPVVSWCARPVTRSRGSRSWPRTLPYLLRGWRELSRTVRRFQPHILHANSAQAMVWIGPVARLQGCRVVWHWRDFYDSRRIAKSMAGGADAIIAISKATLEFAEELLGPSACRLVLVCNGVADLPPHDSNQVAAIRRAMNIPPNEQLVVMAGQSIPRKGHAVLLEALALLVKTRSDLHAWLLCTEHDRKAVAHTRRLHQQAAEIGCGPQVRITEGVEQIGPVLHAADVVVVPSLREPFGRIAVEAMLTERPVIASAVDGLNEIVIEGQTGLLVPPGDSVLLAASLSRILEEPALWESRGKAARRTALRLFSVSRLAAELVSLYSTVCRNNC